MASGLFLMFSFHLHLGTDGFTVRNAHLGRLYLHSELALQALHYYVGMAFAHGAEDDLFGLGILLQPDGRVLFHNSLQGVAELVFVSLGFRFNGGSQSRSGNSIPQL